MLKQLDSIQLTLLETRLHSFSTVMLFRSLTKLSVALAALMIGSWACTSSKSELSSASKTPPPSQTKEPDYVTDPTCCGLMEGIGRQGIDVARHAFTKDGRYRLARKNDFKSAARAFGSDDPLNSIFAYCWGRLGYDPYPDRFYHLAAIVVDTQRTDDGCFGLVIFSAPKNGDGTYQPYWLYLDRDLSRTVV